MLVMAVAADKQPLVDTMVKRTREIRFHCKMAAIAQLRLRRLQQTPLNCWLMNRMATETTDIVLQMLRPHEITVFLAKFMAVETSAAGIRRRQFVETDDFCNVSAPFNMGLAGTMARFTALPGRAAPLLEVVFPVRSLVEALGLTVVTCCAYLTSGV